MAVKARVVLKSLLDDDNDVEVEFKLMKNAVLQEQVCYLFTYSVVELPLFLKNLEKLGNFKVVKKKSGKMQKIVN